ncbi:integral membrane protein [Sodiomyces alkalinus F11]|uniref:Integral membrane protein n=1 Tax=Sodiomyces alkalinus (strain CBS 110278 / VKM F-3762 / F11) TaxID=1314773 RepID=A0A3N2Q9E7_SODAK|nr:integral membrane protein [Sodiomyces alkalinus F11]ROT43384.1 integral membrane protein [Sodiomyces alkalinus F11]
MTRQGQVRIRGSNILELRAIPPSLRPLIRAYLIGYASSVGPKLLNVLLRQIAVARRRRNSTTEDSSSPRKYQHDDLLTSLRRIILAGFDWRTFPTFCAVLVGGSTILEAPIRRLCQRLAPSLSDVAQTRLARWVSTFLPAYLGLRLLQSKQSPAFTESVPMKSNDHPGVERKEVRYAGRTLDLSLFAVTHAIDVIVGELWSRRRARRIADRKWTKLESLLSRSADPCIFACSSGLIMWAWVYHRSRLPRSYHKWISSAAAVDDRLIQALQRCSSGELRYGEDTGQAALLQPMCEDYGWPRIWGDPSVIVPIPCEMVHMGCGPLCEYHALMRFLRSWRWSMTMYLPLNLALRIRRKPPTPRSLARAVLSAGRSSTFLATFIALFYYGVCLTRSRIGPRLLGTDVATRQAIDSGWCVGVGCVLCGSSVLIETASRRKDMALFVAPRALATLFPRRYAEGKQWRETLAFAASAAVVFACARENPARVRGVLGRLLPFVLRQ